MNTIVFVVTYKLYLQINYFSNQISFNHLTIFLLVCINKYMFKVMYVYGPSLLGVRLLPLTCRGPCNISRSFTKTSLFLLPDICLIILVRFSLS